MKYNDHFIEQYFKNKHKIIGSGIKDVFTGAYDRAAYLLGTWQRTPNVKNFLKKFGDVKIASIRICRKPIVSRIRTFGNIVTLGQLNKRVKELGYDEIFHLFSVIKLQNGMNIKLEKKSSRTDSRYAE